MEEEDYWDQAFQEATNTVVQEPQVELPTFEPVSQDLTTLIELGRLEETVQIGNRSIRLRTLTIGEELEIGLLTKDYLNTSEQLRAEITAIVAASICTIDSVPLVMTLGPNENTLAQKFDYVRKNFYWPVIRLIYTQYNSLIERSEEALKELNEKKV